MTTPIPQQKEMKYLRREYEGLSRDFDLLLIKCQQMNRENDKLDSYCEKLEHIIKSNQYTLKSRPII
jgi:hypothetical protein